MAMVFRLYFSEPTELNIENRQRRERYIEWTNGFVYVILLAGLVTECFIETYVVLSFIYVISSVVCSVLLAITMRKAAKFLKVLEPRGITVHKKTMRF